MTASKEQRDTFPSNINLAKYKPYLKDHNFESRYFLSVIYFLDEQLNKQNAKWKPEEGVEQSDIEIGWIAPYLQDTLYGVIDSYKELVSYKYKERV